MASTVAAEPLAALGRPDGPASPCNDGSAAAPAAAAAVTLLSLPTELHLSIARYLPYPDVLSLKQTSRHFRRIVRTDVALKVDWLLERRRLHLDCPNSHRCDLGSDLKFCRGSVALLMRRRRMHFECESRPGLGCLVYGTATCAHRPLRMYKWVHWLRDSFMFEFSLEVSINPEPIVWLLMIVIGLLLHSALS